jgi:hypothetical protein
MRTPNKYESLCIEFLLPLYESKKEIIKKEEDAIRIALYWIFQLIKMPFIIQEIIKNTQQPHIKGKEGSIPFSLQNNSKVGSFPNLKVKDIAKKNYKKKYNIVVNNKGLNLFNEYIGKKNNAKYNK